jgi:thiol-disulfide isomerase/thioredoxin
MKKILLISFILLLTLVMISCGDNTPTANTKAESENVAVATNEPNEVTTTEPDEVKSEPIKEVELAIGKNIPNFTFDTLDGNQISLEDYDGKIILLNFWATWCPYCVQEMPDLEDIDKEEDVVVLAINSGEAKSTIQNYVDENGLDLKIVVDEEGYFSRKFYVNSLPTTYFINEEGILLGSMPGMMTAEQIQTIIQDIRDDVL